MLKRQQRIVASAISVFWLMLASCALASELRIVGQNVVFDPHVESVAHFVVGFQNVSGTTERLNEWSIGIEAVPTAGSIGTLEQTIYAAPDHYILAGNSTSIDRVSIFSSPRNVEMYFDQASHTPNPLIPLSGANLVDVTFVPSHDARGTFNVMAVPTFEGQPSRWTAADNAQFDYENLPRTGSAVLIGTIQVVPEPSTMALGIGAVVAVIVLGRRRAAHTAS